MHFEPSLTLSQIKMFIILHGFLKNVSLLGCISEILGVTNMSILWKKVEFIFKETLK